MGNVVTLEQRRVAYSAAQGRSLIHRQHRALRNGRFLSAHHWNQKVWGARGVTQTSSGYQATCARCDWAYEPYASVPEAQIALAMHCQQ